MGINYTHAFSLNVTIAWLMWCEQGTYYCQVYTYRLKMKGHWRGHNTASCNTSPFTQWHLQQRHSHSCISVCSYCWSHMGLKWLCSPDHFKSVVCEQKCGWNAHNRLYSFGGNVGQWTKTVWVVLWKLAILILQICAINDYCSRCCVLINTDIQLCVLGLSSRLAWYSPW